MQPASCKHQKCNFFHRKSAIRKSTVFGTNALLPSGGGPPGPFSSQNALLPSGGPSGPILSTWPIFGIVPCTRIVCIQTFILGDAASILAHRQAQRGLLLYRGIGIVVATIMHAPCTTKQQVLVSNTNRHFQNHCDHLGTRFNIAASATNPCKVLDHFGLCIQIIGISCLTGHRGASRETCPKAL